MSKSPSIEIHCSSCNRDALLLRQPVYEGFTKVGESLQCASCGHVYASEAEVPYKVARAVRVFTEADRSQDVAVFEEGENRRICRYCVHYVVNPFTQWCGLHRKEVAATDSCDQFEERVEPSSSAPI